MKVDKYLFLFPEAVRLTAQRMKVKNLTLSELTLLYLCRRIHGNISAAIVGRLCDKYFLTFTVRTIREGLITLAENNLLTKDKDFYTVTPEGREFIYRVNRYLINFRL
jgi:hypothetical protein